MNKYIAILILLQSIGHTALAQTAPMSMISPVQLSALAKASVHHEVEILNEALKNNNPSVEGYSQLKIKQLLKIHFRKISPEYAYNKCIFDSGDIATLLSDELTLANDNLIEHSHSLNELRESYGTRIWRLVSQLCVKSQKAFEMRLQSLTANGKQVPIDQKTAKKISKIFFYPTENGKPSVKKTLIRSLYGTVDVAYTVGSIQSLVGFGIGDIIVSLAFISQSAMNFILVDFPRFKIKLYDLNPEMLPKDFSLDLTDEEHAMLNAP